MKREADGWVGLPYVWNDAQTDATLELAGGTTDVQWIHADGKPRTNNYIIPNANQCKGCHTSGETVTPIGPKARHLNRDFAYASGVENQLSHWTRLGALAGAPSPTDAPRLAAWDDPKSGSLDARARAWLEINCAHCHHPGGPAKNSGLDLLASQQNPTSFGVYKTPVAAGRGSGGREFDIVPGQPDKSILVYRIASTDAGIMMPELGKRLVHEEGLALIREWIAAMKNPATTSGLSSVPLNPARPRLSASSSMPGSSLQAAIDGDRFSVQPGSVWKGQRRRILVVAERRVPRSARRRSDPSDSWRSRVCPAGTHPVATSGKRARMERNGRTCSETAATDERRTFRIHRLDHRRQVRFLRLAIASAEGEAPTVREVEFYADPHAEIAFPPWAIVVSTTGSNKVPGEGGAAFRRLARSCDGQDQMQFQNIWLGDFQESFVTAEPRPLCAFLSGNFIDWCQQNREHWRGTQEILRHRSLPMWASCGGAQGLAILAETGVDQPWDCPQCRDPENPRLPIYTHIAGSTKRKCGDYTGCVFERGAYTIRQLSRDPVFRGLAD